MKTIMAKITMTYHDVIIDDSTETNICYLDTAESLIYNTLILYLNSKTTDYITVTLECANKDVKSYFTIKYLDHVAMLQDTTAIQIAENFAHNLVTDLQSRLSF